MTKGDETMGENGGKADKGNREQKNKLVLY